MTQLKAKHIKLAINVFIILGGAISAILVVTPDELLPPLYRNYFLQIGGIVAGALKSFDLLFVNRSVKKDSE